MQAVSKPGGQSGDKGQAAPLAVALNSSSTGTKQQSARHAGRQAHMRRMRRWRGLAARVARSPARSVWFWTVTGPVTPTALCGEAETLQDNGTLCGRRGPAQEGLAVRWRGSVAERVSG